MRWHDGHDSSARHAADGRGRAASREPVEATYDDTPRLAPNARPSFFSYGDGVSVAVAVGVMVGILVAVGDVSLSGCW
jgi:hypothetical protein